MRKELFFPTVDAEARLVLLIHAFSGHGESLEGRTKLAKLDFFLRYPTYLQKALSTRGKSTSTSSAPSSAGDAGMVRYRYGPWDPAYFAILGSLIGRGLVRVVPNARGVGYQTTEAGARVAAALANDSAWAPVAAQTKVLHKNFNVTGTSLKKLIYSAFPEVASAAWGDAL